MPIDTVTLTFEVDVEDDNAQKVYAIYANTLLSGGFDNEKHPLGIRVTTDDKVVLTYTDDPCDVFGMIPLEEALFDLMIFDEMRHEEDIALAISDAKQVISTFENLVLRLRNRIMMLEHKEKKT